MPHGRELCPRIKQPEHASLFNDGADHYCAHRHAMDIKSVLLSGELPSQALEWGSPGDHFCKVFGLDRHLCCQACVYLAVCSRERAFRLPCQDSKIPIVMDRSTGPTK